jgi:hypothetical protein
MILRLPSGVAQAPTSNRIKQSPPAATREGEDLTFQEKGNWVSLRWLRKTDPLMPDGFVPIE